MKKFIEDGNPIPFSKASGVVIRGEDGEVNVKEDDSPIMAENVHTKSKNKREKMAELSEFLKQGNAKRRRVTEDPTFSPLVQVQHEIAQSSKPTPYRQFKLSQEYKNTSPDVFGSLWGKPKPNDIASPFPTPTFKEFQFNAPRLSEEEPQISRPKKITFDFLKEE